MVSPKKTQIICRLWKEDYQLKKLENKEKRESNRVLGKMKCLDGKLSPDHFNISIRKSSPYWIGINNHRLTWNGSELLRIGYRKILFLILRIVLSINTGHFPLKVLLVTLVFLLKTKYW